MIYAVYVVAKKIIRTANGANSRKYSKIYLFFLHSNTSKKRREFPYSIRLYYYFCRILREEVDLERK